MCLDVWSRDSYFPTWQVNITTTHHEDVKLMCANQTQIRRLEFTAFLVLAAYSSLSADDWKDLYDILDRIPGT